VLFFVTVQYAGKNYVVFVGETVSLPADEKMVRLKLEKVDDRRLTFSVNDETATRDYQ